jgi:predicted RNA-binding Zn-ribbon protein involved in translation (DUF1610 family)
MSDEPKYRQRGYKDSERQSGGGERGRAPQGPREKKEGPRGRGLGAPTETAFRCAACGERQLSPEIEVTAVCPKCGQPLHTCSNCMHFDTSVRWECRQPIPARVAKKTAANDCTFFAAKTVQEFAKDRDRPANRDDPRAAFDALFK